MWLRSIKTRDCEASNNITAFREYKQTIQRLTFIFSLYSFNPLVQISSFITSTYYGMLCGRYYASLWMSQSSLHIILWLSHYLAGSIYHCHYYTFCFLVFRVVHYIFQVQDSAPNTIQSTRTKTPQFAFPVHGLIACYITFPCPLYSTWIILSFHSCISLLYCIPLYIYVYIFLDNIILYYTDSSCTLWEISLLYPIFISNVVHNLEWYIIFMTIIVKILHQINK